MSAEWVSAVAALCALGAAVWAGLQAKRLYQVEADRDRQAADDREAADARRVNAWVAAHVRPGDEDYFRPGLSLANAGSAPIFDIEVESNQQNGRSQHPMTLRVLPPGEYFVGASKDQFHWQYLEPASAFDGHLRPITRQQHWRVTMLTFTDSGGVRWQRTDAGLRKLDSPGPSGTRR